MGKAITLHLSAQENHRVYFSYYQSKDAAQEIEQKHPNTKGLYCDFSQEQSIENLCDHIDRMELQALINNACTPIENNHFHKISAQTFKNNFFSNILPTIQITQRAITGFRKRKFGRIITVTTAFLVNKPPLGLSSYVAEKAYLASLCKSWAIENVNFNITSNCIAPSMMVTPFTQHIDERIIENALQAHPFKRLLTPEETAETVDLLLNAPCHVNGATWVLNGAADVI